MHISLIRVSSSNLDIAAASYSLSRRIHNSAAAAAAQLRDYRPVSLLDFSSMEANHDCWERHQRLLLNYSMLSARSRVRGRCRQLGPSAGCSLQLAGVFWHVNWLREKFNSAAPTGRATIESAPSYASAYAQFQSALQPCAIGFLAKHCTGSSN